MPLDRRSFLKAASLTGIATALGADSKTYRAAIIGDTRRGGFGHDLDRIFRGRTGIQVIGVADPDATGREKVARENGGAKPYADWRELLETERPQLVCIAMRHADQHAEIAVRALELGAHCYMEKPFVRTPAEADAVLAAAVRAQRKVAVAHTMRMAPVTLKLREALRTGTIGALRELRAYGKQDNRAGGEDMMVLGTHLFDLMRAFAGDPEWCTARVLQDGRDITSADRRQVKDTVGWVAGNQISAQFAFANGVMGSFTSDAALRETQAHWGIELLGSRGAFRFYGDIAPSVHWRQATPWTIQGRTEQWTGFEPELTQRAFEHNEAPVTDWLEAIKSNREPECSARNGAAAIEMVMGVYQAALRKTRIPFPLTERTHPLEPA